MNKFYKLSFIASVLFLLAANKSNAQISGTVYRDFNANGTRDSSATTVESRLAGIVVNAYDSLNNIIATDTSDANGLYNLAVSNYPVRVEFVNIGAGEYTGPVGLGNRSSVQFFSTGSTSANFGVNYPDDYCQNNPMVIVPRNFRGPATGTGASLEGVYYNTGTSSNPTQLSLATNAQTGTTYGLAYSKSTKTIFDAAVVRNYMGTGPGGFDAIYTYAFNDANDDLTPNATSTQGTTIDLSNLGVAMGTDPRQGFTITGSNPYVDSANLYKKVGKIGIGDIDINTAGDTLYVVNMNDGAPTLVILNVSNPSAATLIAEVAMPTPACSSGVFRPWAVKYNRGKVYIGGVCDAGTGTVADLVAHVYAYDGSAFTSILSMPLDYTRGKATFRTDGTFQSANWRPWTDVWAPQLLSLSPDLASQPQPMLTDIEFTDEGSMVLGFADRFAYQTAYQQRRYDQTTGSTYFSTVAAGDIIKFCLVNGAFVQESNPGACLQNNTDVGSVTTLNKINAPTGVKEFFDDDYYNTVSSSTGNAGHSEAALGALAVLSGRSQILATHFDPITTTANGGTSGPVNTSGIRTYNSATGNYVKGWVTVSETETNPNRKGGALGDIEVLCNGAPLEIGNRVWLDVDRDGIQDANELPIAGVTVNLKQNGTIVGTTTTDANGNYLFNNANITGDVLPNTTYEISINTTQTAIAPLYLTASNTDASTNGDARDNDAVISGSDAVITVNTGAIGANNHSYDFGFYRPASLGNYVWQDDNYDGIQNEPITNGINGATVYLYDGAGNIIDSTITANNPVNGNPGYYLFDSLASGNYQVGFPSVLPNGQSITPITTITSQTNFNNDANQTTGLSPIVTLDAYSTGQNKDNTTIDAGYVQYGSIGNYVWVDSNANGINDEAATAGIGNVVVYLLNASNAIIDSTITDANGFYLFDSLRSGTYFVDFPLSAGGGELTNQTATAQTDNNSDANTLTGLSPAVIIDAYGTGQNRDNTTVDAGYTSLGSIGNYVWIDSNQNGINDESASAGLANVTVILLDENLVPLDTTTTNSSGYYLFDSLVSGNYTVRFPTVNGSNVLTSSSSVPKSDNNSDANETNGNSGVITINAFGAGLEKDDSTIDAGYTSYGSLGSYVWIDSNANGIFDEDTLTAGLNGITVNLLDSNLNIIGTTITATVNGRPGYYYFDTLPTGVYYVQFPTNVLGGLTSQDTTVATPNNSDASLSTGISAAVPIDGFATGTNKDNPTIYAGYIPNSALSLDLLVFSVDKDLTQNKVNWKTAQEVDIDRYELMRSYSASDFIKIATIKAYNNAVADYSYIDNQLVSGNTYYKLLIFNKNNNLLKSSTILVNRDALSYVLVYPNPANNILNINFNATMSDISIRIVDMLGHELIIKNYQDNVNQLQIDIENLSSGNYLLEIESETGNQKFQFKKN